MLQQFKSALLITHTLFSGLLVSRGFLLDDHDRQPCSLCGRPIDVTLTASNEIRDRHFNFSVTLHDTAQRELILLLQEAADIDGRFNFTATYRKGLGFFVESVNGEKGDWERDGSWWHIYSEDYEGPRPHCEGVSAYVPSHHESVVLLLTNRSLSLPSCPTVETLVEV